MMTTVWEIGNIVIDTSLPLRWKKRERLVWKSQHEISSKRCAHIVPQYSFWWWKGALTARIESRTIALMELGRR